MNKKKYFKNLMMQKKCVIRNERKNEQINYREKGITLIALVVTIIILLILAGVTIQLVLGKNGLLSKAQLVSNTMANATVNEIKLMNQYEDDIDTLIAGYINNGESEQGGSGSAGNITIKDKNNNNIDMTTIGSKYGEDVEYNGNLFQLFYVDTEGKYTGGTPGIWLQLKVPITGYSLGSASNESLITTENSILWNLNPDMKQYYNTIKNKTTQDTNIRAVSGLCDPANWNSRKNIVYVPTSDQDKGAFAIGGVSAEMFCDSYNQSRASTETQFGAKVLNKNSTYGYWYKPHSLTNSEYYEGEYGRGTSKKEYPILETYRDGMYYFEDYTWLVSPSASSTNAVCIVADGLLYKEDTNYSHSSRLAVFIPASIEIRLKNYGV